MPDAVDQASYVDQRIAEAVDGRLRWTRFEDLLTRLIVASDRETAARRERSNAERQVANPTRSTDEGMRGSSSGHRSPSSPCSTRGCSGSPTSWPPIGIRKLDGGDGQ